MQSTPRGSRFVRAKFSATAAQRSPPCAHAPLAAATWAATSAAKSSTFFSMPSPTTYSVKPLTLVLARLQHLLDGLLVVLHEGLVEQRDLLQVLLHRALDHLGDDRRPACPTSAAFVRRRSRAPSSISSAGTSALRQRHRLHRRDVHRHVLGGDVVAFELDHHADARAVQVAGQLAAAGEALEAADRHVLADLADQALAHVFQRRAEAVLRVAAAPTARPRRPGCSWRPARPRPWRSARKRSFLVTKSVSQLISTIAPVVPSTRRGDHAFGGDARRRPCRPCCRA